MNFSLYVIGNPDGFDQYPLDTNSTKFQGELISCTSEYQMSVLRPEDQLLQYVYVRKIPGDGTLYLGFVLVFTGVYCADCHRLKCLFDAVFYDVLYNGKMLCSQTSGYVYLISKLIDVPSEYERIRLLFKTKLENVQHGMFFPITASSQIGNGEDAVLLKGSFLEINTNPIGVKPDEKPPHRIPVPALIAIFIVIAVTGFLLGMLIFDDNGYKPNVSDGQRLERILEHTKVIPKDTLFEDWISGNHGNNSESSRKYSFKGYKGDLLSFGYLVSSEACCDSLSVMLACPDGKEIALVKNAKGFVTASSSYEIRQYGNYVLTLKYSKSKGVNSGLDMAAVTNIRLQRNVRGVVKNVRLLAGE